MTVARKPAGNESEPKAKVQYVAAGEKDSQVYSLRGTPGRWFVLRFPVGPGHDEYKPERTKYFPNVSEASQISEELIK